MTLILGDNFLKDLLAADSSSSSSNVVVVCLSVVCDQVEKCLLTAT